MASSAAHIDLPPDSMWRAGLLAPLNIAAYVTWLAVVLQAVDFSKLFAANIGQLFGASALVVVLVLYLLRVGLESRSVREGTALLLIATQGVAALFAGYLLESGSTGILLIIVAGQVFAILPVWQASGLMLALNAGLVWIWSFGLPLAKLPLAILPMFGFQAFAALTARYATVAERARAGLAIVFGELQATQALLDVSARSSERLRLSRELHDLTGHKLTALKLNLRVLEREPELGHRNEIKIASALADELLADIRAVVGELRQHDGIELADALRSLVDRLPGPTFHLVLDPSLRAPSIGVAQTLLRCAQEGITNAVRHGSPKEIHVIGRQIGETLVLGILDDGYTTELPPFGNGLNGMRERLREWGGELEVRTRTPRGVELEVRIPNASV